MPEELNVSPESEDVVPNLKQDVVACRDMYEEICEEDRLPTTIPTYIDEIPGSFRPAGLELVLPKDPEERREYLKKLF